MRRIANNTALLVIYQLIASASVLYGSLSILASIYERNLAFGLLSVIPTIAGVAVLGVANKNQTQQKKKVVRWGGGWRLGGATRKNNHHHTPHKPHKEAQPDEP